MQTWIGSFREPRLDRLSIPSLCERARPSKKPKRHRKQEIRRALESMGHTLSDDTGGFGGYQAILYDAANDVYVGASESRKDGQAAGY